METISVAGCSGQLSLNATPRIPTCSADSQLIVNINRLQQQSATFAPSANSLLHNLPEVIDDVLATANKKESLAGTLKKIFSRYDSDVIKNVPQQQLLDLLQNKNLPVTASRLKVILRTMTWDVDENIKNTLVHLRDEILLQSPAIDDNELEEKLLQAMKKKNIKLMPAAWGRLINDLGIKVSTEPSRLSILLNRTHATVPAEVAQWIQQNQLSDYDKTHPRQWIVRLIKTFSAFRCKEPMLMSATKMAGYKYVTRSVIRQSVAAANIAISDKLLNWASGFQSNSTWVKKTELLNMLLFSEPRYGMTAEQLSFIVSELGYTISLETINRTLRTLKDPRDIYLAVVVKALKHLANRRNRYQKGLNQLRLLIMRVDKAVKNHGLTLRLADLQQSLELACMKFDNRDLNLAFEAFYCVIPAEKTKCAREQWEKLELCVTRSQCLVMFLQYFILQENISAAYGLRLLWGLGIYPERNNFIEYFNQATPQPPQQQVFPAAETMPIAEPAAENQHLWFNETASTAVNHYAGLVQQREDLTLTEEELQRWRWDREI